MKRKWILLKILGFSGILIFLLIFANKQYKLRELKKVENRIDYSEGNYFITHNIINKLLKETHPDYPKMQMQRVSIKEMEDKLDSIPFVKTAQVYVENNGILHTIIKQKKPIARVIDGNNQYYITSDSTQIPLCENFAANTLLISGKIKKTEYPGIVRLIKSINEDNILKNNIIGVRKNKENSFTLLVSDGNYTLELGGLNNIRKKLHNFRVFHQEFIEKTADMPYKKLNLSYNNQIVASK